MGARYISAIALLLLAVWPCAADPQKEERTMNAFQELDKRNWASLFCDVCVEDWQTIWFLDGKIGIVTQTTDGLELRAGPEFGNDAHHMVLWTKSAFSGDVKIEYEYTRLDSETRGVTILYIQATGSGVGPYATDIAQWAHMRTVPAMRTYFDHMNAYHISYAAYPNAPGENEDYIRARRYMPERQGLKGTELPPDYGQTGLFQTGVPHKITVIKHGQELYMHIRNEDRELLCHWRNDMFPPIETGRIGLRHMYTRHARYRGFRVYGIAE